MLLSLLSFSLLITITASITPVPGTMHVQLLPTNQVSKATYRPSSTVHYSVRFDDVPMVDNVRIGVEIRGSNPSGGPRGYIAQARGISTVNDFVKATNNSLQFKLIPEEVYAGYSWFLRPFIYFANESMVSTNMMNSAASEMFNVLKQ